MYRERPALHPYGNNGGDPQSICGSCPDPFLQPCAHSHRTAAGDAQRFLPQVWHESGMVSEVSETSYECFNQSINEQ